MNIPQEADLCIPDAALYEALQLAKMKVEPALGQILSHLTSNERISLVFLALTKDNLVLHGFKICQYSSADKIQDVQMHLWRGCNGSVEALLSSLYLICRFDLLESILGLCSIHTLHQVYQSLSALDEERIALYKVFASLTQLQATQLLQANLGHWRCPGGIAPLEEVFCCNLSPLNFCDLLTELHGALCKAQRPHLAAMLKPFTAETVSPALGNADDGYQEVYEMAKSYPHGLCVIINVNSFIKPADPSTAVTLPTRRGSDIDTTRLEGTFRLFGFAILHIKDPDTLKIRNFFANLKKEAKLTYVAALVVCVMTHGDADDRLYLHDRNSIPLVDIRRLCFSPLLINKPRLIFVQACRGNQVLQPIFIQRDYVEDEGPTAQPVNRESDCLVSSATVGGYSAMRSQSSGSWFISDLCSAMQQIGHCQPLRVVLQRTRRNLNSRVDCLGNRYVMQINEDITTLLKEVRLVRGPETSFVDGIYLLVLLEVLEDLLDEAVDVYCEGLGEDSPEMMKVLHLLDQGY